MMRFFICGLSILYMSSIAYAYTGFGVCNFGKQTVPSVICYGPTVLKQTIVSGDIKVTGTLKAENISAHDVAVEGALDISNSQVIGSVNVIGALLADHVEFQKGVAVVTNNIVLNHSKINGLMTVTSQQGTPYLQVQCNSVITGSVLFDGKAGVIQVTGDSIVEGKVVNGSMEFVKRNCD